ncbi:hypothetical protein [Hymenobacter terrenus]|uniref:hypothetical protein n=1 Tax=Hymenobacter terrenus TaxID=1629124 RepID=UPI00061988CD|nr:hypothetical protein [Hymenobacter terrenus]
MYERKTHINIQAQAVIVELMMLVLVMSSMGPGPTDTISAILDEDQIIVAPIAIVLTIGQR